MCRLLQDLSGRDSCRERSFCIRSHSESLVAIAVGANVVSTQHISQVLSADQRIPKACLQTDGRTLLKCAFSEAHNTLKAVAILSGCDAG